MDLYSSRIYALKSFFFTFNSPHCRLLKDCYIVACGCHGVIRTKAWVTGGFFTSHCFSLKCRIEQSFCSSVSLWRALYLSLRFLDELGLGLALTVDNGGWRVDSSWLCDSPSLPSSVLGQPQALGGQKVDVDEQSAVWHGSSLMGKPKRWDWKPVGGKWSECGRMSMALCVCIMRLTHCFVSPFQMLMFPVHSNSKSYDVLLSAAQRGWHHY